MSRNQREGYYFGKSLDYEPNDHKFLRNGCVIVNKRCRKRRQRSDYDLSLKGYFK